MMGSLPSNIDMDALIETLQSQALGCLISADNFPQDIAFHCSLDRQLQKDIEKTSAQLLRFASRILPYAEIYSPTSVAKGAQRGSKVRELRDEEDITDKYDSIIVVTIDSLLEHAVCTNIYVLMVPHNEGR